MRHWEPRGCALHALYFESASAGGDWTRSELLIGKMFRFLVLVRYGLHCGNNLLELSLTS